MLHKILCGILQAFLSANSQPPQARHVNTWQVAKEQGAQPQVCLSVKAFQQEPLLADAGSAFNFLGLRLSSKFVGQSQG